jgi:hypothetical protein
VFAHFLGYVKRHVHGYITTLFAEGALIWSTLLPKMDVILTIPNGWAINQQQRMRAAAKKAGLVTGEDCGKRVRLVTEGEVNVTKSLPQLLTEL